MSTDVRGWLRQLTDTHLKSTPGPWATYWGTRIASGVEKLPGGGVIVQNDVCEVADEDDRADDNEPSVVDPYNDAAAIVAAHNALPTLVAALTAVLDLADELESGTRPGLTGFAYDQMADRIRGAVAAAGDLP